MKILLVEDDATLAKAVSRGLREEGHVVDHCSRGEDARNQAMTVSYDVVVLDWGLVDDDGLEMLRDLRARGLRTPVLMLTARTAVSERVLGLRAGADDYLGKPFDFDELLARLEAIARRAEGQLEASTYAGVTLDAPRRALRAGTREVSLTPREYSLASEFFRHQGEVLSRFHLITHVWGTDFDGDPNVLDVYVGYLRAKLAEVAGETLAVRNVRGVGFRLVAQGAGS